MYHNAQGATVVAHITKGFVHSALGSIGSFDVNPSHRIGGVAEALNHENFWLAFDPWAPIGAWAADGEARIVKVRIVANEIGHCSASCVPKRGFVFGPGWLERNGTKLISIGRVNDFSGHWLRL